MRNREIIRNRRRLADTDAIDPENIERYIQAYQCPYCKDGAIYKMLALHIYQIHGISAYEFRKNYGMNRRHKLCSLETSDLMSQVGKARDLKAFLAYDRHLCRLRHYKDGGGKRPEAIESDKTVANRPETKRRFRQRMAKIDYKVVAMKLSPEKRRKMGMLGGQSLWRGVSKEEKQKKMARVKSFLTKEAVERRTSHSQKTMKEKYWADPNWVAMWRKRNTEAIQSKAKVSRLNYPNILNLYENGVSQVELASHYGVSDSLIGLIIKSQRLGLTTLFSGRKDKEVK